MSTELQRTIIAVMADADCYLRLSHGYAAQPEKRTSLKPRDPRTDALINASASGSDPAAVTAEASFFTTQLPVLCQPVRDRIWAWKTNVSATDPNAFGNLTQFAATPEFWYTTK